VRLRSGLDAPPLAGSSPGGGVRAPENDRLRATPGSPPTPGRPGGTVLLRIQASLTYALGLSFAARVAEAHGGALSVQSAEGVGTTVQLELPAMAPARS